MILERSSVANAAKSVFFEDINDIDIYIEDSAPGYEKLFSLLYQRVLKGMYKVKKVFPIGDRKSVIDRFNEHVNVGRPSLFIIDGDLFIMSGDSVSNQKGLYKLPFYCIENILCDRSAIIELLDEETPNLDQQSIEEKFDYQNWLSNNEALLVDLFIHYGTTFKLIPEVQTVAYPVNKLTSSKNGDICINKTGQRIEQLKTQIISKVGIEKYEETKKSIIDKIETLTLEKLDIISGKDYLFPLLNLRARNTIKTTMTAISMKNRLAKKCNISKLNESKKYVLK